MRANKYAEEAIGFFESLNLVDDFYGQPFVARPWQRQILIRLFGDVDPVTKLPKVTRAFLCWPRKVGKTYFAAQCAIRALFFCGNNQVVISCAATKKQAREVYNAIVQMIRQDAYLKSLVTINKDVIVCEGNNSRYECCTTAGLAAHGSNISCCIVDELHALTKPTHIETFTAVTTGQGTRKAPLTIMISTASNKLFSLASDQFRYANSLKNRIVNGVTIKEGDIDNPAYLSVLYYFDPKMGDWSDRKVWGQINPALGDYVKWQRYDDLYNLAKEMPFHRREFMTYYLNAPCDDEERWMNMEKWGACKNTAFPNFDGHECLAALDLAAVHDLSCLSLLFEHEGKLWVKMYSWCAVGTIHERSHVEMVPYNDWVVKDEVFLDKGGLKATGSVNDCWDSTKYETIREDIIALSKKYRIRQIGIDQKLAFEMGQNLQKAGLKINWYGQNYEQMGPPTARLEKLVYDGTLQHEDDNVLNYCMSCCRVGIIDSGLYRPSNKKKGPKDAIDATVALIMCVGLWMGEQVAEKPAVPTISFA